MRQSEGALAYIERRDRGQVELLTQWSASWRAFHLIGGHRRPREQPRKCLVREIAEELGFLENVHYRIAAHPPARLRYVAWSRSARVRTAYVQTLFLVELLDNPANKCVCGRHENRWLNLGDIACGRCSDGLLVSPTLAVILSRLPGSAPGDVCGFPRP